MLRFGFNRSSRVRSLLFKNNWDGGSPVAELVERFYKLAKICQLNINRFHFRFTLQSIFEALNTTFCSPICGWRIGRWSDKFDPVSLIDCSNYSDLSCGPLSLSNWAASPYLGNNICRVSMVFSKVVALILSTSSHLECASTTIKNMLLRIDPAKSAWIRCPGNDGHSHGCTGTVLGSLCISWQPGKDLAVSLISLSLPGHQI